MAQKITLVVEKKVEAVPRVYFVTFRLVSPSSITYHAGQNMMLMIAPGINRTMSIASPPSDPTRLLMVHDVTPMGPGSKWTVALKVGDSATIVAPTGGMLSLLPTEKKKILVATGTGIAPFHAMILDALAKNPSAPLTLYWGMRYEADVYWKDEFDALAASHPTFQWHLVISRPTDVWQGLKGHVNDHVFAMEQDLPSHEFYLCGNKKMIEDVHAELLARSVPKEQIRSELFY